MKILIIGGGGREHALAWRLVQSTGVTVAATPGNPGIARIGSCFTPNGTSPADYLAVAKAVDADLTVVGPEAPLVAGIVDVFRASGRTIFGPTAAAARLEGSKIFAKNFLLQRNIPTARFATVDTAATARDAVQRFGYPVAIKADGLAGGKGVVIAHGNQETEVALTSLQGPFVIEEFLEGREVSFIAVCDGRDVLALEPTQDHKTVFNGDTGPNTGGMGAYCDSHILNEANTREILDRIIRPTVEATNFTGFLYAGLMMTASGPKVIEFNVRMGDPETQPLMHRLDSDFASVLMDAAHGDLGNARLFWKAGASICVVLAAGGYPGPFPTGKPITGIEAAEALGATVFHAGTRIGSQGLETSGGRVLGVTAGGTDLAESIHKAYTAVQPIHFEGMHYRTDIGRKGLQAGCYNEIDSGT